MANAGTLEIAITGNATMLKKAVGVAKSEMGGLRTGLRGLERGLGRVSDLGTAAMIPTLGFLGALTAFVGTSVATFSAQEQAMSEVGMAVSGTSEEIQATTDMLEEGVKDISKIVPKPIDDLAKALYEIVASGTPAEEALGMLTAAGKLATAGMGTAAEGAKLLTETMEAYGLSAEDAGRVSEILYAAIRDGKTNVAELSASFGDLAMVAAPMGVSLEELAAATSTLTASGRSTSEATSELGSVLTDLQKPSQNLEDVLNVLGVESGPKFDESLRSLIEKRGLVNVLADISSTGEDMGYRMNDLFGSVTSVNDIMTLTGPKGQDFRDTLRNIGEQASGTGDKVGGLGQRFSEVSDTVVSKTQLMRNEVDAWLGAMGEGIVNLGYTALLGLKTFLETSLPDTIKNVQFTILSAMFGPKFAYSMEKALEVAGFGATLGSKFGSAVMSSLPGFAEGGVVTSPTLAMVGEKGPEAIVPLGSGYPQVITLSPTIIIENPSMSTEFGIEETARKVAAILSDELRAGVGR